jgi:hypothetical protein
MLLNPRPGQQVQIHLLSLGAGVQSSTLALMAAAGEVTPMPMADWRRQFEEQADERWFWRGGKRYPCSRKARK